MNRMDPLADLQDIHLPESASWWPPAPGWILLAILMLVAIGFFGTRWMLARRRNRYRRAALAELEHLALQARANGNAVDTLQMLNALLKRVALHAYPREDVARLHGDAWVRFLVEQGHFDAKSAAAAEMLAKRAYQNPSATGSDPQLHTAIEFARQWVRRHP